MSASSRASFDLSMARLTKNLVIACLIGLASLPGVIWLLIGSLQAGEGVGGSSLFRELLISTVFISLISGAIALGLWICVFAKPVSAIRHAESRLRATKMRDPLTGLINRTGLLLAMASSLKQRAGTLDRIGVILIDVDRFRLVNHAFGRPVGDELLQGLADRIRMVVRTDDLLARVSVDQFAIKVDGVTDTQGLIVMARNILRACAPGYPVGEQEAVMTISIGIATTQRDAESVDAVLDKVELALQMAKRDGGNCFRVHEDWMQGDDADRLKIETRLRQALGRDEFRLIYQPIVNGESGRVSAVEVLLRWHDAENGVVEPDRFLPYLEQSGDIAEVGLWVLKTALTQCKGWMSNEFTDLMISVNVSPRQFVQPDFVEKVRFVLLETGFPSSQLQLEITESLLLDASTETLEAIDALSSLGVSLVLDDFGKGYSSLTYLKLFPLHGMKIDRIFTRDIVDSDRDRSIIRAIVDLGHGLGIRVTAEGVETSEQCQLLRKLGCDALQGFLFSPPVDSERLLSVLRGLSDNQVKDVAQRSISESSLMKAKTMGLVAVDNCVRIMRNNEVLATSGNAIRLIEKRAQDWETILLVPQADVCVALSRTEDADGTDKQGSGDQPLTFDLVGTEGQILHRRIAKMYQGVLSDGIELNGRLAFDANVVTIEELPLNTAELVK